MSHCISKTHLCKEEELGLPLCLKARLQVVARRAVWVLGLCDGRWGSAAEGWRGGPARCGFASCSLPARAPGRAARWLLIHTRNKPSPFLTLSDVLGFLLFVDLGLAFCRYLSLQKRILLFQFLHPIWREGITYRDQ